jgi:hypothetical protein
VGQEKMPVEESVVHMYKEYEEEKEYLKERPKANYEYL